MSFFLELLENEGWSLVPQPRQVSELCIKPFRLLPPPSAYIYKPSKLLLFFKPLVSIQISLFESQRKPCMPKQSSGGFTDAWAIVLFQACMTRGTKYRWGRRPAVGRKAEGAGILLYKIGCPTKKGIIRPLGHSHCDHEDRNNAFHMCNKGWLND